MVFSLQMGFVLGFIGIQGLDLSSTLLGGQGTMEISAAESQVILLVGAPQTLLDGGTSEMAWPAGF